MAKSLKGLYRQGHLLSPHAEVWHERGMAERSQEQNQSRLDRYLLLGLGSHFL